MPQATVLIPTYNQTHTLGYAIQAVQRQTLADFELFVVGDGAPERTRDLVLAMAASDPRIRYFDFPKGKRHGEANRATALNSASGQFVCYCCDDNLWLPNHLELMAALFRNVDVGHSFIVEVDEYDRVHGGGGDLSDAALRKVMCETIYYNAGLATMGHTFAAYRRLPGGWSPAPENVPTDLHMLRRFIAVEGLRFGTEPEPSTIRFGPFTGMMRFGDLEQPPPDAVADRLRIATWCERITSPDVCESLRRTAKASAARRTAFGIYTERVRQQLSAELRAFQLVQIDNDKLLERLGVKDAEIAGLKAVIEGAWSEHAELRKMLAIKDAEIDYLNSRIPGMKR